MNRIIFFFIAVIIIKSAFSFPNESYTDQYLHNSFNKRLPSLNPSLLMDYNTPTFNVGVTGISTDSSFMEFNVVNPIGLFQAMRFGYFNVVDKSSESNKHLISVGIAQNPIGQLNWGANVNYIYDIKDPYNKHYGTLDVGLSYNYLRHQLLGVHTVGVALQNALSFGSGSIQSFTQPAALDFMWRVNLLENKFENVTNLSINNIYYNDEYGDSLETKVNIFSDFKFRFKPIETSIGIGNNVLGASAGFRVFTNRDFDINTGFKYHYFWGNRNLNTFGGYLNFDFGKDKMQNYVYRMANKACICAHDHLYNKLRREIYYKNYYPALFYGGMIPLEYPDYYKNDWVHYYLWNIRNYSG